jgi:peptidyl-prolyl cis-trans isomerase SurA
MIRNILIISFLFLITHLFAQVDDPVLFTVNDTPINVSEFKYIYQKNNGKEANFSKESLNEYLDLYVKFKLKVEKARQLQYDTIQSLNDELAGYRKQLANAYLVDKEVSKVLVDEAYERIQKDIRVSHILVSLPEKVNKDREAEALDRLYAIKEKLDNGAEFGLMAKTLSDDKRSAKNNGDLGWITAILPNGFYEFENALYTLEVGEMSQPVRTKIGYHLIKKTDSREARGEMNVSHVLIRNTKNGKPIKGAREKADSLYQQISTGANFEEIARTYSDDKSTAKDGGALGYFGIGLYDVSFEDAAFKLENDGDISIPIKSKLGWHIIRRNEKKDYSNEAKMKSVLKGAISQNDRFEIARKQKIEDIKVEANFVDNPSILEEFTSKLDQSFFSYKWVVPEVVDQKLASFNVSTTYSLMDFVKYCKDNGRKRMRYNKNHPVDEAVAEMYELYIDEKTVAYEEANLERKYPDFRSLMREYSEGVLLFEVTKENVWDKASSDTVGLKSFFEQHKENYQWKERAEVSEYAINSLDKNILKQINRRAENMSPEEVKKSIEDEFGLTVYLKTVVYENDAEQVAGLKWKEGHNDVILDKVKTESVVRRINYLLPAGQKTLKESRGYVISDYQDVLENEWVNSLKAEFPIKINEDVLSSLYK